MSKARYSGLPVLMLATALALAGCNSMNLSGSGSTTADNKTQGGAPPQISGVALPEGYSLDADRTIILGEGDRWIGRLSYSINSSADAMFDFVRGEMANHGWREVAVVRAETSQLTFISGDGDRVASILITRKTLYGSKIDMTVSPSSSSPMGAAAAAPRTPVQRR
jgi:predicted small secreted protein